MTKICIAYRLSRVRVYARARKRNLEFYCPKDFHNYSGVAVCLAFCRKKICSVFKNLLGADSPSSENLLSEKKIILKMRSKAVLPKDKWVNPHLVARNFDALRLANPVMPDWMVKKFLRIVMLEESVKHE